MAQREHAPARRPTLRMVAERAGVSTATVSYVFSGRAGASGAGVAEATAARVMAAAEELNYRPNTAARLDLRAGIPDTSAFPRSAWASAMRRALTSAAVVEFGYGEPAGVGALRRALAEYLGRARGVVADMQTVHVTHGAGHAVRLLGAALAARGVRRVAVEEYGHAQHRDILRSALSTEIPRPRNLGQAIHERFGALGGVDLPDLPREPIRAVDLGE